MNICVYCSSSPKLDEKYYASAREFGRALAERGHSLVYGGYDKGIMGEVARGAAERGGRVTAVVPKVFDREGFTFSGCGDVIITETMSERKATMEQLADAFAVLPGGIGTFDELFEVLALKVLGLLDKPAAALNVSCFFDPLAAMLRRCKDEGFLNYGTDVPLLFCADADELLDALEREARA